MQINGITNLLPGEVVGYVADVDLAGLVYALPPKKRALGQQRTTRTSKEVAGVLRSTWSYGKVWGQGICVCPMMPSGQEPFGPGRLGNIESVKFVSHRVLYAACIDETQMHPCDWQSPSAVVETGRPVALVGLVGCVALGCMCEIVSATNIRILVRRATGSDCDVIYW